MKRYRIFSFDFDSRASLLEPIQDHWEEKVKELHLQNQQNIKDGLFNQFGTYNREQKLQNFIDLGQKPFSITAFHNKFLEQVRNSYVIGCYYPALTGVCALGERILNHLILLLRDYHTESPEYKKIYKKSSFDNWALVIDALESWGELLPEAVIKFRELNEKRNRAIHFNPETDTNDKSLSIEAIHLMQEIIAIQFSAFGPQPWYFVVPGEIYIKKEWEDKPLIKHLFLPNTALVGPKHTVESLIPRITINDRFEYEDREITDEEFIELRKRR